MKNLIRCLALLALTGAAHADYLGDFAPGTTAICGQYTTINSTTAAPATLAGTPALSVYKIGDGTNSTTESTTGVSHAEDVDARTGMNRVCIDTSADGTFYSAGSEFSIVITTGTVNSVSVVGTEVKNFSLRKGTIAGIPNATAGASGGVQIAGSNAATTYATLTVTGATTLTGNVALSDGLTITRSTANQPGVSITGNGTGNGATITGGSGATGTGLALVAASTNGAALTATGTGTGNGATFTSGGGATGNGAQFTSASTNGNGIGLTATGTGATMTITPSNVQQYGGSAGTFASGRPEVNTTHVAGSAVSQSGGLLNANVTQLAGTSLTTLTGSYPSLGIIDSGTAQAATSTTLQLRSAANFDTNDELVGATCVINTATTGAGQARTITAYTNSTDTATVSAWTTTPTGTITYVCFGTAAASAGGAPTAAQNASAVWEELLSGHTTSGSSGERLGRIPNVAAAANGGLPTVNASNQVAGVSGNVVGSVGSVTGNVGGNVTGSVGSVAAAGITDSSFATTAGAFNSLNVVDQGTAQAATGTTIQLRSAAAFADNELVGNRVFITGGTTGVGQSRLITNYTGSTDTATVAAWSTTPTGTITYKVASDTAAAGGAAPTASQNAAAVWDEALSGHTTSGSSGERLGRIPNVAAAANGGLPTVNASNQVAGVSGNVVGSVGSVTGSVGSVTGNVGGNVTGSIGSLTTTAVNSIRDMIVEDQGSYSLACVEAVNAAILAGDFTTSGATTTFKDPISSEVRAVSTVVPGVSRSVTITCPTLP